MANNTAGEGFGWRRHAGTAGVAAIAAVFGLAAALVVSGREKSPSPAPIISNTDQTGADPVGFRRAGTFSGPISVSGSRAQGQANAVRVLSASAAYTPQSSGETYPAGQQAPAPIVRGNNASQNESLQYNTQAPVYNGNPNNIDPNAGGSLGSASPNAVDPNAPGFDNQGYADASPQENAGYEALEQADQAPPPLPEYDQPPAPDDNYLWTPGYWGFSTGYYWVPGAWVAPPFYGALWTPPWWGSYGGRYLFHRGYWGTHIGFYGGINYGHGYVGSGFYGGYWQGRSFYYNRAVTNVNITRVHNVYQRDVVINNATYNGSPLNRTSFNGPGGVRVQPRPYELAATREAHYAPVPAQVQVRQTAASNRSQFYVQNHGRPAQAFDQRPLGSSSGIANVPQRPEQNRQQYGQGQAGREGQAGRDGFANLPGNRSGNQPGNQSGNQPGVQSGNQSGFQPGTARAQPTAPEVNRAIAPAPGVGGSRNDLIQQRTGLWNGDRGRNLQTERQQDQQVQQQQQRGADFGQQQRNAAEQGRNLQLQQQRAPQQQQQDAVGQSQRDVQLGQQQQRNQQVQQQRDAAEQQRDQQLQQQQGRNQLFQQQRVQQERDASEQQRNLQFQLQQQQRSAAEQEQRNSQFQQQRQAAEQQRNLQFQQQQQQRSAAEQGQRNLQFQQQQQQRQAMEQQRSLQFQQQQQQRAVEQQHNAQPQLQRPQPQPQHIEARPAPFQQQPHAAAPGGGGSMHGHPQ